MRKLRKFEVGIKAFIVHEGKLLMMQENRPAKTWEIPGGRIDVGEERLDQEEILQREIREELGDNIQYHIERPILTWVRELVPGDYPEHYVFLVGYLVQFVSGEIRISDEHLQCQWLSREECKELSLGDGYEGALEKFWETYKIV